MNSFQKKSKIKITVSYEKNLPKTERFIEYDESDSWYFEKYGGKFETKECKYTFEVDSLEINYNNFNDNYHLDYCRGRPFLKYIPKDIYHATLTIT